MFDVSRLGRTRSSTRYVWNSLDETVSRSLRREEFGIATMDNKQIDVWAHLLGTIGDLGADGHLHGQRQTLTCIRAIPLSARFTGAAATQLIPIDHRIP